MVYLFVISESVATSRQSFPSKDMAAFAIWESTMLVMSAIPWCNVCQSLGPLRRVGGWWLCDRCERLEYDRLAYQRGVIGGPEDGRSKLEMRVRAE